MGRDIWVQSQLPMPLPSKPVAGPRVWVIRHLAKAKQRGGPQESEPTNFTKGLKGDN